MITLIITLLAACSPIDSNVVPDYRAQWSQHEPNWVHEPPTGEITWSLVEGSTPKRDERFSQALDEWQISLACRFTPRHVMPNEGPSISFHCSEPPSRLEDQGKITTLVDPDSGKINVWVKPNLCDYAADILMLHAAGHGLGHDEMQRWYPTVMDGFSIVPDPPVKKFSGNERDGLRIWALRRGAPGCGDRDPEWSWVADPDYYAGDPPDVVSLIGR